MRKLQTQDVFKAIKIINAADLKDDFKEIMAKSGDMSMKEAGFEIMFKISEKVAGTKTENAIYEFLAGPLEKTAKEVKEMELLELVDEFKECVDPENWKVFFKSVSALMTK